MLSSVPNPSTIHKFLPEIKWPSANPYLGKQEYTLSDVEIDHSASESDDDDLELSDQDNQSVESDMEVIGNMDDEDPEPPVTT